MRMMVMFDLPVDTKAGRKAATQFRNFLLKDGYYMMQYSIYTRICNGVDSANKHKERLKCFLPDNGAIRLIIVTEKQFQDMDLLLGKYRKEDESFECQQLSIF